MKGHIILYFLIFTIFIPSFGQKGDNGIIKRMVKTETKTQMYNDGKKYVNMVETTETDYDIDGLKTHSKHVVYYQDSPYKTEISTFEYNENKMISNEKVFIVEDSVFYNEIYMYENDLIKNWHVEYVLNDKEIKAYSAYNSKVGKLVSSDYKYIEREIETNKITRDIKAQFFYDKNENLIEENWLKSDSTYNNNRYLYIRTRKGRLKEKKEYDEHDKLLKTTTFKYKFDKKDNWILRQAYVDKTLIGTIYREIEYYD